MRSHALRPTIRAVILAMGIGWLTLAGAGSAADAPDQTLPDADYPKMLAYAVKGIQDALRGQPKEEMVGKAHTAAIMIAAYAQENLKGADGQQRATVRDAALKLAETIDAKKFADALKQAQALASLPADPKAKTDKIKLIEDKIKVKELMQQFGHPPEGGWGIERQFYQYRLGMKGSIPGTDMNDKLLCMAYQVAVTAELLRDRNPPGKLKEWETFTGNLWKGAKELAEAVKAKDGRTGNDNVTIITTNCTSCHKAYRVKP